MQTQPVNDIEAVLGRFQAWAGVRNAVEAKTGIRELSEEEALRSNRYRWKGAHHNAALQETDLRTAEPAPERVKAGDGKRAIAKKTMARKGAVKRAAAATPEVRKDEPALRTASAAKKITKAAPEFREALAEAVRPAEVLSVTHPVEVSRQLGITVRLSPTERALIRTRAAEAGISGSAYIRQCALEVEQLRAQVRQAIAVMERGGSAQTAAPAPGIFVRLVRRFFPRREPALALRA